ncbi:carcinoembryonic antigen-related cell adhesion molecule 5-like [Dendropsophus ebraccatus]|uniref:carcinoembryonic antigen-related cell adhesion molecule 5-like n=1 Tax=Dendropsophus ebraccatus TaxID=150705 RepID=UPI003831CCDB
MIMTKMIRFGLFLLVQIVLISGVPYLQTIQNLSIYVAGDDITLVCCSQFPLIHLIFQFYKEDSVIHSIEQDKNCASYMFKIATQQESGPYKCAYKALENGTYVQSNMSDPITFQFADTPLPPSIMLVPSFSVYTTKESMDLTCVPPEGTAAKGVQIYREEKKIHEEDSLNQKYEISMQGKDAPGKYHCKYWVEKNGRRIGSTPSEQVIVKVTNVPQAPDLALKSEHSVYIEEEAFTLTCSFPQSLTVKEVWFYRNGELLPMTNIQLSNTCAMVTLNATATAKFTCQYVAEISGRSIASDSSNEITIITTEQPLVPSITLEPLQPVYITGEVVSAICSVPDNLKGDLKSVKFYRSGQNIDTQKSCKSKCIYQVPNPTKQLSGEYTCEYLMSKYGRELSAHSKSVQVTFIDIPQAPSITLIPKQPVYLKGETIDVTCSLPEGSKAISIQYFKEDQEIHKPKTSKTMSTFELRNLSLESTGHYTCQYWRSYSGRNISSYRSSPHSITVEEIPQSPSIDLSPMMPVYTSGESISIKCLPPTGTELVHIRYFKDGTELHKSLENVYSIPTLSQEMKGSYSCGYMCIRHGRQLLSKMSHSISISVVDIPQAPSIILTPKQSVYFKGENVSLTCSIPEVSTAISILYFKDSQEIHKSEAIKTTSSYQISNLSLGNTGQYKCQYWLTTSGRNISSSVSLSTPITVEEPPVPPVLKLTPDLDVYVVGQSLVITCSGFVNARHYIYKDSHLLKSDFSHQIESLQLDHNGNYACTYSYSNKGRQVESSRSQTVNIYVTDPFPAPTLTLGGPVVKVENGFKLTLNCSAPDDDLLRTFYYFSTTEENDVTNLTDFSALFESDVGPISHISYICEYDQELRGRKIRSKRSQTLSIQLMEASVMTPPVIAGIIGAVSLILCLTLALWFYMKSKKYNRHNRFRLSWYWKENPSPKKPHSPHPLKSMKNIEETNQEVLDLSGEDHYKTVSRNPSCLSVAIQKETDALDKAMNFSTFHREALSDGESAWNSSTL